MDKTFIAIKPGAVQRGLIGEVIQRFEKKGFKIIGLKILQMDRAMAEKHYAEHIGKPFFKDLADFITSGPLVAMVIEGENAVESARNLMGSTNPLDAAPGTIRADLAHMTNRNVVHGSDSKESAEREIAIFFDESELISGWERSLDCWYSGD